MNKFKLTLIRLNVSEKLNKYSKVIIFSNLFIAWFYWDIVNFLFFFSFLFFQLWNLLVYISGGIQLFKAIKYPQNFKRWFLVFWCFCTIGIYQFVPYSDFRMKADFFLKNKQMKKVINDLQDGIRFTQASHSIEVIQLPLRYWNLSRGGNQIIIDNSLNPQVVTFFYYRGILDSFSGFVYTTDGSEPDNNHLGSTLHEVIKLEDNWWFVIAW